jgi:hypothetical protein
MWNESEPQYAGHADLNDILAEIDAIDAPTLQPEAAPEPQPVAATPHVSGRFKAAFEAWHKRHAAYLANPDTYEATLARCREEQNRKDWRAEYALRVDRPVRDYERDQTPERRKEKKAAKSKEERSQKLAASTPEQIAADKKAARLRAKASRDRKKQIARPEGFGKF